MTGVQIVTMVAFLWGMTSVAICVLAWALQHEDSDIGGPTSQSTVERNRSKK
jgi:hypothetical protein